MLRNFDVVLAEISEKVEHLTGPVMKLHTLEGLQLSSAEEMKSGDSYVAVGREIRFFRKMKYGLDRPPFNNSPKRQSSRNRLPPLHRRKMYRSRVSSNQTNTTASRSHATGLDSVTSPGSSEKSHNRSSVARNERVPRPPHRASPKKEEDKVFPAKPIKHRRSDNKPEPVDYDKDDGGVFRAKSHQEEAMEVEETKDTKVDRPIDQVEAEEVKDEEIEAEHPNKSERKLSQPRKSASEPQLEKKESEKDAQEVAAQNKEREKAAVKIQANYRGFKTRKTVKQLQDDAEKEKNEAAVKIQARYRGYKTRKEVQQDAKKVS
ncbi:hypothetical protein NP493_74g04010 [Ridgeia piscesae]|uniref:Doublecortin domain-containing protein n=1 Tax=Ridgeia piscesae TaxID=27915 RepID=A0AAD9P9J1_RIDPI|nr:hypothetical protein NP493_74g04010 [Ridgeia piscesae]